MPSSYTSSLRFELQFTGENVNLWGDKLNAALSRVDTSVAGWLTKALTGDYSLTTANGAADEARTAMLKFTGSGTYTVTVPAVSKRYDVWNACTGDLTLTNGSTSVVVKAGEVVSVVTDGGAAFKRVQGNDFDAPTSNRQAATKKYVDDAAFSSAAGNLPGQPGNAGKFLTTDGSTAGWGDVTHLNAPAITGGATIAGGLAVDTVSASGALTGSAGFTLTGSTKQSVTAVSAAAIDLSASDWFTKSISANTTFTFTNATASKAQGFVLDLTITSAAVPTWPASVKWAFGAAPVLGNGRHIIGFITDDGGTSYIGKVGMQAVA